jgi:predicted chitinase
VRGVEAVGLDLYKFVRKTAGRGSGHTGYHECTLMKSTATSLVLGLGLLYGCGGDVASARGIPDSGAGTGSQARAGAAGASIGGSAINAAGSSSGGSPAAGGSTSASGSGSSGQPCGPAWAAGTTYAEGAIVLYQGAYFIAEHENPGYDPVISTYFWEPYECTTAGGGGSGAGGSAPLGDSALGEIVTEALFGQMFPDRNHFYTYRGLVDATRKYAGFAATGSDDQKKREVAAFLANVARETGELVYIEQIQKDVLCAASAKCPCAAGKSYYGRGPIQISWNYNYCSAGEALGYDLVNQPELVAQDATIAWATGLWFWMTQRGAGQHTPHDAIVGDYGFGETIRSINGDVECNGGSSEGVTSRVAFYQRFCQILGVSFGDNLSC